MIARIRRPWLIGSVATVVLLVAVAFWAGRQFQSPEQAAAQAQPPDPSLITVAAEVRSLDDHLTIRGRVLPGPSVPLKTPSAAVGPDSVVTKVPLTQGAHVWEGTLLVVRSGRPVMAMALGFPLYRDLVGGMDGPDVTELQRALNRMGYSSAVTGVLRSDTQAAIKSLYSDRGFVAPVGDTAAQQQLPVLQDALAEAKSELAQATTPTPDTNAIANAQRKVDAAQAALDHAVLLAGPGLPRPEVAVIDRSGRTVTAVAVKVGDILNDPARVLFELDGGSPYLQAFVSHERAALIVPGQRATVADETTGTTGTATVSAVGQDVETDKDTGESGYRVTLSMSPPPAASALGRGMRIDLVGGSTSDKILAVPLTAVYSRADGTTYVVVSTRGATAEVGVVPGKQGGGWVAVTPTGDGQLAAGDLVVVGMAGVATGASS